MNLLGGGDGATLADPERARSRSSTPRARCLEEILGYPVEAPVRIDDVRDMGEWKTAWDHIAFEGFLGVRMKMQFTWEGCDSALAAPLLLDLARLGALALERGDAGVVAELAFFFKDPAGTRRARARPAVRDARSAGCARRSRREAPGAAGRWPSSSACPRCSACPATCSSARPPPAACATCRRAAGLAGASSCLYLAGMALNDYADREVDARRAARRARSRRAA